jgi:hypothetical protein
LIPESVSRAIVRNSFLEVRCGYQTKVTVFSLNGRTVFNKKVDKSFKLPLSFPKGEYVIQLANADLTVCERILVK